MKDSEFIELLNLYLDHEISAADAARLEIEVRRSPERRKVYRDYCRMQKACVLLAEQASEAPVSNEQNVIPFEPQRRSWGIPTYVAGFCAAAACVALALVMRTGNGSAAGAPQAADPATVAAVQIHSSKSDLSTLRDFPSTVSVNPRSAETLQPVFATHSLGIAKQSRAELALSPSNDPRFDWMHRVNVASLQRVDADQLLFESKPALQPDSRTYRSRRMPEGHLERAAFQFQR